MDKSIPTYPRWKSGSRCSLTDNRSPCNGQRPPAHREGHWGFCLKLDFSRGSVFNSHGMGGWALEVPFRGNPEGDAVQSWGARNVCSPDLGLNGLHTCRQRLETTRMEPDQQISPTFPIRQSETRAGQPLLSSGGSQWGERVPRSCFGHPEACGLGVSVESALCASGPLRPSTLGALLHVAPGWPGFTSPCPSSVHFSCWFTHRGVKNGLSRPFPACLVPLT